MKAGNSKTRKLQPKNEQDWACRIELAGLGLKFHCEKSIPLQVLRPDDGCLFSDAWLRSLIVKSAPFDLGICPIWSWRLKTVAPGKTINVLCLHSLRLQWFYDEWFCYFRMWLSTLIRGSICSVFSPGKCPGHSFFHSSFGGKDTTQSLYWVGGAHLINHVRPSRGSSVISWVLTTLVQW